MHDGRDSEQQLEAQGLTWLESVGVHATQLEPMAGDVSSRRYYRVNGVDGVLAHYPAELRRSYACFVRTDELLCRAGVRTPEVLAVDQQERWMLTEDVGTSQLSRASESEVVSEALEIAKDYAERIAHLAVCDVTPLSPALDQKLLTEEVMLSCRLFFESRLAQPDLETLEQLLTRLCAVLGQGRLRPAHRDYMARNLMLSRGSAGVEVTVLDHQDLRLAPWGYDVASLYFDSCPLAFEAASAAVEGWPAAEREAAARCAVQRCIKIVGTFVRFAERGNRQHLPMVSVALRRAASELRRLPEADEVVDRLLQTCADDFDRSLAQDDDSTSV